MPPADDKLLRVLVVEDEVEIYKAIRRMLLPAFECQHAGSAEVALAALAAGASLPDIALVDVGLPVMSGLELCDVLARDYPALFARTALMTGSATPENVLGMSSRRPWLFKPFSPTELRKLLDELRAKGA